jgi:hypothetical protein
VCCCPRDGGNFSDLSEAPVSDVGEEPNEDPSLAVMRRDIQDPVLYKIYENLPTLESVSILICLSSKLFTVVSRFCDIQPFMVNGDFESPRVSFSSLIKVLSDSTIKYVGLFFFCMIYLLTFM